MGNEETLYRDLQIHLDKQTIGFPATSSGSDIILLKQLFPPEQAEIALAMTYRFEPLVQIHARVKKTGQSIGETARLLNLTASKGMIGFRNKDGVNQYKLIPYVVGMLEAAAFNADPEVMAAHMRYSEDGLFWRDFINTKIPQVRTIPIQKSITPKHHIGTYDEVRKIIEATVDPIAILECVCREGAERSGSPCKRTTRKETCMVFRETAKNLIEKGSIGRKISREEALEILQKNQDDGLVLQPGNSQEPEMICSCCGCCCGLLKLHKFIPNPVSHWAANFYAEVDPELCTQCGLCEERCQVDAIKLSDEKKMAVVDLTRCLGCGLCVEACPEGAVQLRNKAAEVIPPQTTDDMMEVIMVGKAAQF
jgi:Na+-translocating ferredoxin:NAD+ oxidoreductase subunit B